MKHLMKIFESTDRKEQYEIISDFFLNFLEDQDENAAIYCEMDEVDGDETYCIFRAYYSWTSKMSTLEEYADYMSMETKKLHFLGGVNSSLKRLSAFGYTWEFEEMDAAVYVAIYYKKEGEETLELALDPLLRGHKALHESILKRVLRSKYGLNLSRVTFREETSRYHSDGDSFLLWFPNDSFGNNHPFYKDLVKIIERMKLVSSIGIKLVSSMGLNADSDIQGTYIRINLK